MPRTPATLLACLALASPALAGCGGKSPAGTAATAAPASSAARLYRVPSQSMEPTLPIGARVPVEAGAPGIGEIVVFRPPAVADERLCGPTPHVVRAGGAACPVPVARAGGLKLVKRIVAGPGDEIYIRDGHVFRRARGESAFVRQPDAYARPCARASGECDFPTPITIPAGHWFLLGDNRGESDDSRFWGPVPTRWIEGVVTASG
jgi:signal peptidase I